MKRILLTCTLAFTLLPVSFAGEGVSPPSDTKKNLLIDYVDPLSGQQITEQPIRGQFVRMV